MSTLCRRRSSIEGRTRPRFPRFVSPIPPKTHGSAMISSSCRLSHNGECTYILRCGDTLMYVHLSVNSVRRESGAKCGYRAGLALCWSSPGTGAPAAPARGWIRPRSLGSADLPFAQSINRVRSGDRGRPLWRNSPFITRSRERCGGTTSQKVVYFPDQRDRFRSIRAATCGTRESSIGFR